MEQLKVFSMRIESDVVNEYSIIAHQERAWSRSAIMARVLKYVLKHADRKTLIQMVRNANRLHTVGRITIDEYPMTAE